METPSDYIKICITCGEAKVAKDFFNKKKCAKDGYQPTCRLCESKRHKKKAVERHNIIKERKAAFMSLSVEEAKKVIYYDSVSGLFYDHEHILLPVYDDGNGYVLIYIKAYKIMIRAHRLAWFLTTGEWSENVDHINGDKQDNRIQNLRGCSARENLHNQKFHRKGKLAGVKYNPKSTSRHWSACTKINKKYTYIGSFETEIEASKAYFLYMYVHEQMRAEFIPELFREEILSKTLDKSGDSGVLFGQSLKDIVEED